MMSDIPSFFSRANKIIIFLTSTLANIAVFSGVILALIEYYSINERERQNYTLSRIDYYKQETRSHANNLVFELVRYDFSQLNRLAPPERFWIDFVSDIKEEYNVRNGDIRAFDYALFRYVNALDDLMICAKLEVCDNLMINNFINTSEKGLICIFRNEIEIIKKRFDDPSFAAFVDRDFCAPQSPIG